MSKKPVGNRQTEGNTYTSMIVIRSATAELNKNVIKKNKYGFQMMNTYNTCLITDVDVLHRHTSLQNLTNVHVKGWPIGHYVRQCSTSGDSLLNRLVKEK